ncbi:MAG: hypothetical protein OXQ29_17990 [Rhodospirillaceae bacterium]|nr:hypothetical protein [Rhodospirillaceae bacterium]
MTKQRITAIAAVVAWALVIPLTATTGWVQWALSAALLAAVTVWAWASGWQPDGKPTAQNWSRVELAEDERIISYHTYYSNDGITLARVWTLNTGQSIVELNQRRVATVQMRFTAYQTAEIARNLTAAGHTGVTEPSDT